MRRDLTAVEAAAIQALAAQVVGLSYLTVCDTAPDADFEANRQIAATVAHAMVTKAAAEIMGDLVAAGGAAAALGAVADNNPETVGEILDALNVDAQNLFGCSFEDMKRFRTAIDLVDALAIMETEGELQDKPGGEGMSGDEAVEALSSLITWARQISRQRPDGHPEPDMGDFHAAWMRTLEARTAAEVRSAGRIAEMFGLKIVVDNTMPDGAISLLPGGVRMSSVARNRALATLRESSPYLFATRGDIEGNLNLDDDEAYRFEADVPGHKAPDGGEL